MKFSCSNSACSTKASYTDDEGIHYCHRHRKPGLQNVNWKPCTNCGVVRRLYDGGKCTACRTRGFIIRHPVITQPVVVKPIVNDNKIVEIVNFIDLHQKAFLQKRYKTDCERITSLVISIRNVYSKIPELIECSRSSSSHYKYSSIENYLFATLAKKKKFETDGLNKLKIPENQTNGFLPMYQELMDLARQTESVVYDYINHKFSFVLFRTNRDVYRHVLSYLYSPT